MIVPVMAISNLVLTRQIYSEETNGAHAHYREPVPLRFVKFAGGEPKGVCCHPHRRVVGNVLGRERVCLYI